MGRLLRVLRNAFLSPGFRLFGLRFARDYLRFAARCARSWGSTGPGTIALLDARIDHPNQASALFLVHEIFVQAVYDFAAEVPAPRIVDCGANVGFSIVFFRARYPACSIIAFEPHPVTFERLRRNIERAGYRDVELRRLAVAEEAGEFDLVTPENDPGSIVSSITSGWTEGVPVRAAAIRLSTVIRDPVDLLKLDVEGAEYGIVRDLVGTGAIAHVREAVIEFHEVPGEPGGATELRHLLQTAGMTVHLEHHPSSRVGLLRARRMPA
jgi:FkbM family methyltransferase